MKKQDYFIADNDNEFSRIELERIFISCIGKTFGYLDRMNVFAKAVDHPKITGIAGDVVEQSILGMKPNSRQEPDLVVDDILIELKTTGLRKDSEHPDEYVAKDPLSVTAVSIGKIIYEDDFDDSMLWHKLQRILFVYYFYDSPKPVPALMYSNFKILSYQFYAPSELDRARFESDWLIVRNYLRYVQETYDDPKEGYPLLSTNINDKLVALDTAPKYPNPPRFRIKRKYLTAIVKRHFSQKLEILDKKYVSYAQLDEKIHEITYAYKNHDIQEIANLLGLKGKKYTKQIAEQLIVRMFGGVSKKLSKVEVFTAFGIYGYSIALSAKGTRTEDTKMCPIDFDEIMEDKTFEESDFYTYFHDNTFLFFISQETQIASQAKGKQKKIDFGRNCFLGFKRIHFDDEFIMENVKPVWDRIRYLISTKSLQIIPDLRKDGTPIINKTGEIKGAPNFPKSTEGKVFVRGTSSDSTNKPLCINGINMYRQNLWIRGDVVVDLLDQAPYI